MNILISHAYSKYNNGDAAILSAQIRELQRVFDNPSLHILTLDSVKKAETFDSIPMTSALMHAAVAAGHSKLQKLSLAVVMMSYTAVWATIYDLFGKSLPLPRRWRQPLQLLVTADMQVCVGGGYLRSSQDGASTVLLMLLFHQIWLAKRLHKPVYLYAQSFGPYPKSVQRFIAKRGLKSADLILVREAKSMALLKSLGIVGPHVIPITDSAFLFSSSSRLTIRKLLHLSGTKQQLVGVTVRRWLDGDKQTAYEQAVANFIDHISKRQDVVVVIIPQVTSTAQQDDDRVVGRRIAERVASRPNVICLQRRLSAQDITVVFGGLDYLIGTRFHSVIFALTAGVPAIAIEYEHKTSGIMQDLGLSKWVIQVEAVTTQKLETLFDALLVERATYIDQLHRVLPDYILKAKRAAELIKQAYEHQVAAGGLANE